MKSRLFWILAAALFIGLGVVIGGAAVYFGLHTSPVQAAAWLQTAADRDVGILVGAVEPGSPADQAGIVRGDIIIEANGAAITLPNRPIDLLKDLKPGDTLALKILHGDETRDVSITLGDKNGNPFLGISPAYTVQFSRGMIEKLPLPDDQNLAPVASGARVTEVISGSPAENAGLKPGDIILKVNDQTLDEGNDLAAVLGGLKVGDSVTLNVQRVGETSPLNLSATLGENPNQPGQAYLGIRYMMVLKGFGLNEVHPKIFPNLPFHQGPGLFVISVTAGSPAEQAGIKPNDVITQVDGSPVTSADDLAQKVQAASPGDKLTLTINRSGEQNPLALEVTLAANPENDGKTFLGVTLGAANREFQRIVPPANPSPGTSGSNT
jgi:S1-C subfamily serine protease